VHLSGGMKKGRGSPNLLQEVVDLKQEAVDLKQ
jgi:hypothetical protein